MKVKLFIKTTELDNKTTTSEISAIKKIKGSSIIYKYIDESGKTELEILSDSVIINRFGEIKSSFILKKDSKTSFKYKTSYFSSNLNIITKKLAICSNGFECSYSIFQEETLVNNINISIYEI
ncbi:DUF1934 family protein [Fusobacterium sp. MFO224]|uniref:DUF1934 family protein n=1 Tax=Fusobacterium sp. MFO224 TaxID=3378070 RepID=UPI003852DB76